MDRPIKKYYDLAVKFVDLPLIYKQVVGYNLGIIDEKDYGLPETELEEIIYEDVIKNAMTLRFEEEMDKLYAKISHMESKYAYRRVNKKTPEQIKEETLQRTFWGKHADVPYNILK